MKDYDIVIIDSGCNPVQGEYVDQVNLSGSISQDDLVGHGSSIVEIIHRIAPNAKLLMIKVTDDYNEILLENLLNALCFIIEKIKCRIINISMGLVALYDPHEFVKIIKLLNERGIIVISAYDNSGFVSYPAAFTEVIGVDCDARCKSFDDYIVIENSIVDILGSSSFFRSVDQNNKKTLVKGTSFASAAISAHAFNAIRSYSDSNNNIITLNKSIVLDFLKKNSLHLIVMPKCKNTHKQAKHFVNHIQKAVVFPFNKEIHALANFEDLLKFIVVDYYDHRFKGIVNRKICEISPHIDNDKTIKNIESLQWESFDTIICGHCKEISRIIGKDILSELIQKCIKHNKKMYCFDNLAEYAKIIPKSAEHLFFYPCISKKDIPYHTRGKMALSYKPIIGVYGTSSKQGKYTLQLLLRKHFMKLGYSVGEIGSEPSGYLFGFDYVYPYGYENAVEISNFDAVLALNNCINDIEQNKCDIIITGAQSNTVPYDAHFPSNFCFYTYDFLIGTIPDAVILCVNANDPIEYIERTIKFINCTTNSQVIAISVFPDFGVSQRKEPLSVIEEKLTSCNIPVYYADKEQIPQLANCIISYLSQ